MKMLLWNWFCAQNGVSITSTCLGIVKDTYNHEDFTEQ